MQMRQVPANDLDLQMTLTNPAWSELPEALRLKLIKVIGKQVIDGKLHEIHEEMAGVLGIYTRDLRLGNLTGMELELVRYYFRLSVDLLSAGMVESSLTALNHALSVLETSSSKNGFLRRLLNTFRTESVTTSTDPKKTNLLGAGKQNKYNHGG